MTRLQTYLAALHDIRATGSGTKETSYYPAFANLFNELGATLKPKVSCIIQQQNTGAGVPDGGFFTAEQKRKADEQAPLLGQKPARGVIEIKPPSENIDAISQTIQVKGYLAHYGQLLITNLRAFVLLAHQPSGGPQCLESFEIARDESSFWNLAANPSKVTAEFSQRFEEYLKRVLLHAAPLNNPKDVAFFLASYARDARARVESAADLEALANIRIALEEALGMKFEDQKGERFFRSTLVQTLFYGVFSAWVLWHKENPNRTDAFDWKSAAWTLHVPMIKALFEQVATPTKLGPLGLVEPLNWTAAALNRVNRPAFFQNFVETHAVQYFYEPFLEAFDPDLRKQLGVWYTPPEIVQYMVARVDTVLREELDIPDGLADRRVFVLDPCCGTGAFLVEVLNKIAKTLRVEKGEGAIAELAVKEAAQQRVFGFEILPAPFVVAHLQLGLLLQKLAVPLDDKRNERVGVFLTNALTGWDFAGENPHLANWPELEAERKGAGRVKQEKPILVVLGNPPYNAFAGVSPEEEQGLVEPYKNRLLEEWRLKKFNLDDLYVRFFRLAERRIAEKTGKGIVCYISNFSYLSDPSFVVMRQRFLKEFDSLWIDCLNGDSRETGKLTPDGRPDPSVFSTEYNREGIRVGTAIALMARNSKRAAKPTLRYRQFWGASKRDELLQSLNERKFNASYTKVSPHLRDRFAFTSTSVSSNYLRWPLLIELAGEFPYNGLFEKRASALIDISRDSLALRMRDYFDLAIPWGELVLRDHPLTWPSARFDPEPARKKITAEEAFDPARLKRYLLRPFDIRWCYYSPVRPLWAEPRPRYWEQLWQGNEFLVSRPVATASPEGFPFLTAQITGDHDAIRGHGYYFPFRLRKITPRKKIKDDGNGEFGSILHEAAGEYMTEPASSANLSPAAKSYLANIGIKHPDSNYDEAALIWLHSLAVGYSLAYLTENSDGIRQDWPRIPLPDSKQRLVMSAKLGRRIADLLNTERAVEGTTDGKLNIAFKSLAVLSSASDLALSSGWGHRGESGITMPGKGKLIQRAFAPNESNPALGAHTYDVYLNESTCWTNIPEKVWDFTIGGYQVIKKWLSYREFELLGRPITPDEAREVTHMARRIAALILLQPDLDKNYQAIKSNPYPFKP